MRRYFLDQMYPQEGVQLLHKSLVGHHCEIAKGPATLCLLQQRIPCMLCDTNLTHRMSHNRAAEGMQQGPLLSNCSW